MNLSETLYTRASVQVHRTHYLPSRASALTSLSLDHRRHNSFLPMTRRRVEMIVDTVPKIRDARELQTILTTSLRALWGNLECYSASVQVVAVPRGDDDDDDDDNDKLCVTCPAAHAPKIQAALTCVTAPPYLQDTLYRLDVVRMEYKSDSEEGE